MKTTRLIALGLLAALALAVLGGGVGRVVFAAGWGQWCELVYEPTCSGCKAVVTGDPPAVGYVQLGTNSGYRCLTAEYNMECTYPVPMASEQCVEVQLRPTYSNADCTELTGNSVHCSFSYFPCEHS